MRFARDGRQPIGFGIAVSGHVGINQHIVIVKLRRLFQLHRVVSVKNEC